MSPAHLAPAPAAARPPAFVAALAGFGDAPAVAGDEGELTYADLARRVERRAAELGPGRRLVMIGGANRLECLVTYLGALAGGHVAWLVPEGGEGAAELQSAFAPDVTASADGTIEERRPGSAHDLHPDLALLLGTSGSTGAPRLVRLSRANLQSNAEAIASYLDIRADDRAVTSLPLHYCYGLSVVHSHLLRGACLLLTGRSVTDPGFWRLVRGGGTSFAGVPHTFDLLDRMGFERMDLPSLRCVTQAGGRLAPAAVRRYARLGGRRGWRFVVMYGQTEATARMAYLPPELAAEHPGAVGVPIPGGAFHLQPVPEAPEDGVGELVYRGPNVMLGYATSPADLALGREVHELCTGDLARRGVGGLYEIVGRRARFLKIAGLRVDLDAAERLLAADGLAAACAGTDERLVVAVVGRPAPAGLARGLAGRLGLPPAAVEVRALDELPRLPSGKTDYAALAGPGPAAPPPARAAGVAAVFRQVLDVPEVRDDDTFAGLGGDSLSYVEMSLALEEELGHLPPGWPELTVAELAATARERRRGSRVETNVVLRAAAIVLVVLSHMTAFWPAGGAHLLLALAGHSFARFQVASAGAPGGLARAGAAIGRIAAPAVAWIALVAVVTGGYTLGAVLLVNNYTGGHTRADGRWHYWFIEALVQLLVVAALLLALPPVRRLARDRGFLLAMGLLAVALTFRFDLVTIGAPDSDLFRPHAVAWLFLLGWAVHAARGTGQRLVVSAVALAVVPGFSGDPAREAIVAGGLLLLTWLPVTVVPRALTGLIGLVAGASLYIYLTHWQVFPQLDALPVGVGAAVTVAAGIAAWLAVRRLAAARGAVWPGGYEAARQD